MEKMDVKKLIAKDNWNLEKVMKKIDVNGYGLSFIIDNNNKFVGLVTNGDIRRAILEGHDLSTQINTISNKNPIVSNKGENINKLYKRIDKEINEVKQIYGPLTIPVLKNNEVVDVMFMYPKGTNGVKAVAKSIKKVLVVGGAGYLGSVLIRKLLSKGYYVRVLDNLTYGNKGIKHLNNKKNFNFINGDVRDIQTISKAIRDMDAVIHLAAIVGDSACDYDTKKTIEINYLATKALAEACKYNQINRFLFASTCSVYGSSMNKLNEESEVNPLTLYAKIKLKSESILELADENFQPTILRLATLYGYSQRMRFDLVVNLFVAKALYEKKITVNGGDQYRPFVHVSDVADAFILCLESPINKVGSEVFNVCSSNYKIKNIANEVTKLLYADIIVNDDAIDKRDYNVSSDKIKGIEFDPKYGIKDVIKEITSAKNRFSDFMDKKYWN